MKNIYIYILTLPIYLPTYLIYFIAIIPTTFLDFLISILPIELSEIIKIINNISMNKSQWNEIIILPLDIIEGQFTLNFKNKSKINIMNIKFVMSYVSRQRQQHYTGTVYGIIVL